ncbi:IS5 family transposase [Hymenobacter sp. HDW8]|uniref:IS5 family transposase n=1 Tax=Hymenobacter sp. HDW8 TaxID=2714932 RepID=UPI00140D26C4|nr:IS5 family transposase [Hymenobacter sp. HDW8]QIL77859.1 IS5 family transposase [Hymenobacter sp. HDW8]
MEAVLWLTRNAAAGEPCPPRGQLAHDLHTLPALDRLGVWPGMAPCTGQCPAHAAGRLTTVRAHQHASGRAKNGPQASGAAAAADQQLHVVADAQGRLVRVGLTAGQRHDAPQALPLLEGLPQPTSCRPGYDADPLVAALAARGTCAVIPPRRKRRYPRAYDAARYAQRHPIERLFSRLKQFRRVATRYDKLDAHF